MPHTRHAYVIWIAFLVLHQRMVCGTTLLRTGHIDGGGTGSDAQWLAHSGHRRQLLGEHTCSDPRWGPLCGRVQLLLQLADGYTPEDAQQLVAKLHDNGAVISSALPQDTWLVLLQEQQSWNTAAYHPHVLVPYSPEYKVAPEWAPIMELVHTARQQQSADSAQPEQHIEVHKRILQHKLVQQLQVAPSGQHLRNAARGRTSASAAERTAQAAPEKILVGVHFPDVPDSARQRLGVKATDFHPAEAAVNDWQQALQAVVLRDTSRDQEHLQMCQPELRASSPWGLDVAVCPQDLSEVLYWLSNQAAVHWLAPRPRLTYQNKVASAIVQSSTMKTIQNYQTPDAHVFWSAGLDGKGQIVGMGDSGIDMRSCYFADPAAPFAPAPGADEWANPNHRKVVYYWGLADETFRDLVGHGTHTSGSVAGFNPDAPDSRATGAAKGARLAFADLSRTAGGDVNAPQDLEQGYFPRLAAKGACIFTDSWGSTSPIYDFQASKLDSWLYKNQDCISHFAAGNYGENDNLDSTITSPATAKNAVTVGATKTAAPNYISQTIAPVFMMSVEIKRPNKPAQYLGMRLVKADFGGNGASLSNKGLRVVRAVPDVACDSLDGAATGGYSNTIVLTRRGTCYFSRKMAAGAAAGAAAVIVINDKPGGHFKMDAQDNPGASGDMPLFAMTRRSGEQLWALFENAESVAATIERYAQGWPAYQDIASFSSFGPTSDRRIKPDIVGPGELVSAASADMDPAAAGTPTCNMGRKAGTSMATPMVAGHTAIIRQYFVDGFYPSGAVGNAGYLPSGPLLKAVMLGGACDMQGNTEQYLPLEDSPSMRQGFGLLCLCNSLRLGSNCTTNMQFVDRVPIVSKDTHKYCVRSSGGGDVRITLVWYDYPAPVSAEKTLVNDLDLTVVSGGMGGQAFFGNMDLSRDDKNTVERVWLRNVPPGGLDITVSANQLSPLTPTQNYSLTVTGDFVGTLNSPYNPDVTAQRVLAGCSAEQMAAAPDPAAAATAAAAAAAAVVPTAVAAAAATVQQPTTKVVEEKAPAITAANASASAAARPTATTPAIPVAVQSASAAATPAPQPTATGGATSTTPSTSTQPAAAGAVAQQPVAAAPLQPGGSTSAAAAAAGAAATAMPAPPAATYVVPPATAVGARGSANPHDKASLVNALVGAMTTQQPSAEYNAARAAQAHAAQAAATLAEAVTTTAVPQGRRLSWVPTPTIPAWLTGRPNISVSVKVPTLVCRWLNVSGRNTAARQQPGQDIVSFAALACAPAAAAAGVDDVARERAAGSSGHTTLLVTLPAALVAATVLLMCLLLLVVGMRRYSIARSISLTSSVQQQTHMNKRLGRAATGEASLQEALLADPDLLQQLSPSKCSSLALDSAASGASGFSNSQPASPTAAAAAAGAGSNQGVPQRPTLKVARFDNRAFAQSAVMPGSPSHLTTTGSEPTPLLPPAFSLGLPSLRCASYTSSPLGYAPSDISPSVYAPSPSAAAASPVCGVATAAAAAAEASEHAGTTRGRASAPAGLEVLVEDHRVEGPRSTGWVGQAPSFSAHSNSLSPSGLRRGSQSFTFGALPHLQGQEAEAGAHAASSWGLFGLGAGTSSMPVPGDEDIMLLPGQLRCHSMKEQLIWQHQQPQHQALQQQQQQQAVQLPLPVLGTAAQHRPLSPADAAVQRDQQ